MAEREILTLKRKKTEPVIVVAEELNPPAIVELPVAKKTKKIKPNWEVIYQLAEAYPQAFFIKERKPLAVGIFNEIAKQMPKLCKVRLRKAMWKYCNHRRYLRAIIAETQRIDLTGQPVAEITAGEKSDAQWRLDKQRKKRREDLRMKKLARKNEVIS